MRASAGDLDRRITIERYSEVGRDGVNEPVSAWVVLTTVWARRRDVSDGEREASGQVGSTLMSRFVIRSTVIARSVLPTDRINYRGFWNIQGIKETNEGRQRFLEITAAKDAD